MTGRRLLVCGVAASVILTGCGLQGTQEELTIDSLTVGDFRLTVTVGPHAECDGEPILQVREVDGSLEIRARRAVKTCDDVATSTDFDLDFSESVAGRTVRITQPEGVTHCPESDRVTVICE